jgi:cephalosporin hydroxylase
MKFSYPPKFEHDNEPALWQNPWEFRRTMGVIKSLKTESLLEIGTGWGLFAQYLRRVLGVLVKSIDKEPFNKSIYLIQNNHLLVADSQTSEAFEWAFEYSPKGGYDVVYIDGAHTYKSCLDDFNSYSKLAKKAVMIHDIDANQEGDYPVDYGPSKVWDEVIKPKHRTIELHAPEPENCGVGIVLL